MADEVSILVVTLYHCIMSIFVMSICIEIGRWESHITIPECSWGRSVRKLYDYSGVLLWIMSPLAGRNRTGTTSYVARGGVRCNFIPCWYGDRGHAYALHLHCFKVMCIEVLCYHEVDMRRIISIYMRSIVSFIIRGVLSNSCMEVVHLFYIMSLFSLWKLCWINNLIMNLLCVIITCILLWLNWCLIKWMTCLDSLLAEIYSHPIMFFRCLIWMLWLKGGN